MADSPGASSGAKPAPVLVRPQLIVGLGNPGAQYAQTRHNIGFMVIDALAKAWQIPLTEQRKFKGEVGEGFAGGAKVRLLKPLTYMNASGESMRAMIDWYKIPAEAVLVVYDDLDLPFGRLRLRLGGSAGGHNGMKSAISHLGTEKFPRLRLGIGNSQRQSKDTVSHVLGQFMPGETPHLPELLQLSMDAIELCLRQSVEKAMNVYNTKTIASLQNSETGV